LAKKKADKPQRTVTRRQLSQWQREKRRQRFIFVIGSFIIAAALIIVGVGWYVGQYRPSHQTAIRVNDTEFNMGYYVETLKVHSLNQPDSYLSYIADDAIRSIEQNELVMQGALNLGISVSDDEIKEELKSYDLPNKDVQRDLVETKLLINKLRDEHFEQLVPVSAEQGHVMAMLLESEHQANEVRAGLESGDNFTELAEELSLDYLAGTNHGDFSWHPKDILIDYFGTYIADYTFNSEVGVLSQPIYDEEVGKGVGYWLINVLERDGEEANVQAILLSSEEEALEAKSRIEAGKEFGELAKDLSQLYGAEYDEGGLGTIEPGMMSPVFDEFVFNPEIELDTLSEPIRDEEITTRGGYWLIRVIDKEENRPIDDEDREMLMAKTFEEWVSSLWDDPENDVDGSYLDEEKKAWAIEQATKG